MENIPIYGTHYPVLAAAVQRTQGPVLELGCGHFSTPLLHLLCMDQKRPLVTVESNQDWMRSFTDLSTSWHTFIATPEDGWPAVNFIDNHKWGVALVDHSPGESRKDNIRRLKDITEFIVVHDTESPGYGYEPVFSEFKYRADWRRYSPWTTVVSMSRHFEL